MLQLSYNQVRVYIFVGSEIPATISAFWMFDPIRQYECRIRCVSDAMIARF